MRAFLTALLVIVALPMAGHADEHRQRLEAARAFAQTSGMWQAILIEVSDLGSVVADSLRQDMPELTASQGADIRDVVNARFETEQEILLDAVAGVLASHLSTDDLNALTAYFDSAPGRAQAGMIARGREMTVEEMTDMVMALPPGQRAEIEAFGDSAAARNWLAAQPRFMREVEEVSNQFGENLVRGASREIRAILSR